MDTLRREKELEDRKNVPSDQDLKDKQFKFKLPEHLNET